MCSLLLLLISSKRYNVFSIEIVLLFVILLLLLLFTLQFPLWFCHPTSSLPETYSLTLIHSAAFLRSRLQFHSIIIRIYYIYNIVYLSVKLLLLLLRLPSVCSHFVAPLSLSLSRSFTVFLCVFQLVFISFIPILAAGH